ncbi:MAG TPA: D-2-hydroxyacid dehydrogenase [Candidatus Elarobacter sp.]|jgi:phosphoglycerate dehydrogenase-like enzyme|nr:D-2-hydroxyacid dehydrogenase [Candidatus Elarobacter sp.]
MRVVIRTHVLAPQFEALAAKHGAASAIVEDADAMRRELADADAFWTWPAFYDAELVTLLERHAPRLRWVQLPTMGYDPVELHGVPPGVTVTSAGDAYAPTVSEHAVAMLLALVRRIPEAVRNSATGTWDQTNAIRIATLNGATVAVIGFGNIGRAVAERLRGFGARVVAVTRSGRPDPLADETAPADALHEVLARSDAVVLAVPLNARTRHLLDARALGAMQPHALVINIARGGVIDHDALREALAAGRIGGAGLDVTDPEPLPADDPLWTMPNVLITPHVAGYGGDVAPRRILALVERNLAHFLAGRPLESVVPVESRSG